MSELTELEQAATRAQWAAMMVARNVETCRSILLGLPVRAGLLDRFVLRRALRGAPLPDPETYLVVTTEMLGAIHEAGPLPAPKGAKG